MRRVTQNNTVDEPMVDEPTNQKDAVWKVFPKEHVEPLRGLLFLGRLEHEFEFAGHTFFIRTLTEGEQIHIGQLTKQYRNTAVEMDAKVTYMVAACVEYVDGERLFTAISPDEDVIYEKSKTVMKWYPAIIAKVFEEYTSLENTAREVIESLKK